MKSNKIKAYELNINDEIIVNHKSKTKRVVIVTNLIIDVKKLKTIVDGYYCDNQDDYHKVYRQFDWVLKKG